MNSIAWFFTIYWMVYFPLGIAYNELYSSSDEILMGVILAYTFAHKGSRYLNPQPWRELYVFIGIVAFYFCYSCLFGRNVIEAIWLDLMQETRPYSVVYCTWILNPQFSRKQKRLMLGTMLATLGSWLVYHPAVMTGGGEIPVLGQLAVSTGMAWYLFTAPTRRNRWISMAIVLVGMLAPKDKFVGEVVCFAAMAFFVKKRFNFKSPKLYLFGALLVAAVLFSVWDKFSGYYIDGMDNENLARPMTYRAAWKILWDYFPFGPGMGTFACVGAMWYYSPLYYEYGLNNVWGMSEKFRNFICDSYFPTLAQFGVVGVLMFCWFWKRRLVAMTEIVDMRYYRMAWMAFFCLAIEQTADSSWLSGKGMGYCMIFALCLNANRDLRRSQLRRKRLLAARRQKEQEKQEHETGNGDH